MPPFRFPHQGKNVVQSMGNMMGSGAGLFNSPAERTAVALMEENNRAIEDAVNGISGVTGGLYSKGYASVASGTVKGDTAWTLPGDGSGTVLFVIRAWVDEDGSSTVQSGDIIEAGLYTSAGTPPTGPVDITSRVIQASDLKASGVGQSVSIVGATTSGTTIVPTVEWTGGGGTVTLGVVGSALVVGGT